MVLPDLRAGKFYMWAYMESTDDNVRSRFEHIMERRNPKPLPLR